MIDCYVENDNETLFGTKSRRLRKKMTTQTELKVKIMLEMASFQRTIDELRLLKKASKDLQKIKRMALLRKFD